MLIPGLLFGDLKNTPDNVRRTFDAKLCDAGTV